MKTIGQAGNLRFRREERRDQNKYKLVPPTTDHSSPSWCWHPRCWTDCLTGCSGLIAAHTNLKYSGPRPLTSSSEFTILMWWWWRWWFIISRAGLGSWHLGLSPTSHHHLTDDNEASMLRGNHSSPASSFADWTNDWDGGGSQRKWLKFRTTH